MRRRRRRRRRRKDHQILLSRVKKLSSFRIVNIDK